MSNLYSVGPEKSRKIPAKFAANFLCKIKNKFADELLQERRENNWPEVWFKVLCLQTSILDSRPQRRTRNYCRGFCLQLSHHLLFDNNTQHQKTTNKRAHTHTHTNNNNQTQQQSNKNPNKSNRKGHRMVPSPCLVSSTLVFLE